MSDPVMISVVIPTHNRAVPLGHCLVSLQNQTLSHDSYEVIIVDDASEDETPEVVRDLHLPETFRYARQAHGGSSAARNRGAKLAQGDLILFFDDDVVGTPYLLEAHLKAHQQWGCGTVLGYTPFANDLPRAAIMEYHRARWRRIFAEVVAQHEQYGRIKFNYFISLNLSVSRSDFEAVGPFSTAFNAAFEDTELGLRFSQAGIPLRFCKEALAWHRPSLDERSLTERQVTFGYCAGRYYMCHLDNEAMNECMNVSYVFGRPANENVIARIRSYFRRVMLSDWTASALLLLVSRAGNLLPGPVRDFLCAKIKWYYYSQGFKHALAEVSRQQLPEHTGGMNVD